MAALPRLSERVRRLSRVAGVLLITLGALVVLAWAIDDARVDRLLAGRLVMQRNSGLAFALAGAALWLHQRRRVAAVAAAALVAGGAARLLLGARAGSLDGMEPDAALALVLAGAALLATQRRQRQVALVGQALAVLALLVALVALFGFTYSVKAPFGVAVYSRMTLGSALGFIVLGAGILCADPERGLMAGAVSDSAGGVMVRRLYPAAVAIPMALGWLTLKAEQLRLFNGKLGLTLFLFANVAVLLLLISLTYRALDRSDGERLRLAAVLLEEAGRRHLAKELHDEVGQSLTALKLRLQVATARGARLAEASALVDELMQRVSNLSLDLRPAMLDDLGLLPALVWLFERHRAETGLEVEFAHAGLEERAAPVTETAAFRIVQEALTNAARHAGAAAVTVRVWRGDGHLGVQVADAGRGFDVERALAAHRSSGLGGMRERALGLGGTFAIDSRPGAGTRLEATLPLTPPASHDGHHMKAIL